MAKSTTVTAAAGAARRSSSTGNGRVVSIPRSATNDGGNDIERRRWSRSRGTQALLAVEQAERPQLRWATLRTAADASRRRSDGVVIGVFAASGAAGLMYQVVWSSQLIII